MPGEVLIKFKGNATDTQLQDVVRIAGVTAAAHIQTAAMKARGDNGLTRAITARPVAQAIQALQNHPAVEFAQPNWVYKHQEVVVNDPFFVNGSLWGMYGANTSPANAYGSGAAAAWAAGSAGSKDVYVGVVDEGLQFDHPDLEANIWTNPGEIAGTIGVDDDGNGYVDDIHGWNAIANNGDIFDATYDDHGTHVAGTIGAVGGNFQGVAGVNWTVNIISGKFLGPESGTTLDAIEAIDYMTALKSKGVNIVALNNSWSGGAYDAALLASIVRAAEANILFVAAAGNGNWRGRAINTDTSPVYPACYNTTTGAGYDAVISVTAIDSAGAKPTWANYGLTTVDLGAPGVGIYSTVPTDGYASYGGTSMATPHVAGAIALYAAQYPGATPQAIRSALLASTTATSSLANTVTKGRLDIVKFLAKIPEDWEPPTTAPVAPSDFSATPVSHTQINLAWTDNSGNETRFEIERTGGVSDPTTITLPANTTAYTDSGLTAATIYNYSIKACNNIDCSGAATASATTLDAPAPASATFVGPDTTTQGTWINLYGDEGYDIIKYKFAAEAVTPAGCFVHTLWDPSDTELCALQTPDGTSRFLQCYYSPNNTTPSFFTIDLNFTDKDPTDPTGLRYNTHRVSLYCVDYDAVTSLRTQTIEIFDRNYGNLLDEPQTLESFVNGTYLTWDIAGPVTIKITRIAGDNAVVSGIFIGDPDYVYVPPQLPDPPAAPSALKATAVSKSQIDLSWTDESVNESGFKIERSKSATTGFVQIATVGANATAFQNTGLAKNTTYYYRVRAYNDGGNSEYSNIASAKTPVR